MSASSACSASPPGIFRFASSGDETRTLSRAVVDSLPFGAVVADRDGKISYVNAQYGAIGRGLADGVPVGVPRLFAGQPEASEAVYRLSRAARDGRPALEDIRIIGGLGGALGGGNKPVWYRVAVRALPDVEGSDKPLVLWSVEDITRDRERQDNAFLELQRAIDYLDHAPAGFFSADQQGRVQYLNSTLADWLGYDLAEFDAGTVRLGRHRARRRREPVDARPRGWRDPHRDHRHRPRQAATAPSIPVRLLHRAARLADGELGETRTLVLDRRGGVQSEEALRASEIRFSRFSTTRRSPSRRSTARAASSAPTRRSAASSDGPGGEATARPSAADVGPAGRRAAASASPRPSPVPPRTSPRSSPSTRVLSREGDHAVRLYISGSEEAQGSPERVNVYALDMTEQRKLEAQFAQGQKMQAVGQLAGGVAHDFNNVLTAIIGFSDLLLLKHKPGDPSFQDLMSIKQSANRAAGLTRQLLAFSRRQTLRPQVLEIPTHIDDLTVLLKRLIGEQIVLKVDHGLADLAGEGRPRAARAGGGEPRRQRARRDAQWRLDHAAHPQRHRGRSQRLHLYRACRRPDYVLIEVEDTGTGMSPEILEKIFEPFFSTKELGKGTGLGLSTVYGIIKQTGGFIYPDSEVGKGTTFRIFLPRHVPAEGENVAKVSTAPVVKDLTGHERILLVEDEDNVRAFSARALRATGYEVFEADSGEEALDVLDDIGGQIDLMISDVVMPEMDGPALLIKVRERLPDLKVIFVSGYAEENVRQDIADDQSVEFLAKPYSLDQINSKVKEVLGKGAQTIQ